MLSMYDKELVLDILTQIKKAVQTVKRRFENIKTPEDFTATSEGLDMLDGICMQLIAIGESLKNIDKITGKTLLPKYPEIDWKGVKGIHDIITHHYFDIDAEEIFWVCENNLIPLGKVILKMIDDLR